VRENRRDILTVMGDLLTSITGAVGTMKLLMSFAKGINDAHLSQQVVSAVMDLQSQLLNTQMQSLELVTENQRLQDEIRVLKANALVFFEGNARWEKLPDGSVDGPLCDICWGISAKRVHLVLNMLGQAQDYVKYCCDQHLGQTVNVKVSREVIIKYRIETKF